jgi:hypothetical protein
MKVLFTLLIFCFTLGAFAQEVTIRHYQRKWSCDTLQLPYERFDPNDLMIPFPDSFYNGAVIRIKNFTWKNVGKFRLKMVVENDTIKSIVLKAKGSKRENMLLAFDQSLSKRIKNKGILKTVSKETAFGRRTIMTLSYRIEGVKTAFP